MHGPRLGRGAPSEAELKEAKAISEILKLASDLWEDIYARFLIGADDVPDDLRAKFAEHKQRAREVFVDMNGEWWKRGLWMRIRHALDSHSDKMRYELDQEQKVIKMLLSDMADVENLRMPPCAHRRRVVDDSIHFDCVYGGWNGACGYRQNADCWMCAFLARSSGADQKRCSLGLRCSAAESGEPREFGKCESFMPVQVLECSKDAAFTLISLPSQKPELRSDT